jgi:hypothetical protein
MRNPKSPETECIPCIEKSKTFLFTATSNYSQLFHFVT